MLRSYRLNRALGLTLLLGGCLLAVPACGQDAGPAGGAPTAQDDAGSLTNKVSYFMGFNLMSNLKRQGEEVDLEMLIEGMKAAMTKPEQRSYVLGYQMMSSVTESGAELELPRLFEGMKAASAGQELGMSKEESTALMESFQKLMEQKQLDKMKAKSAENTALADAYMAKQAAENPNIKMLENGVQYEVLKEGTGPMPTESDRIKVDYHGTFLDGTVFDSTISPPSGLPPEPAEFGVTEVVAGFSKSLQAMKVGSKWRVVIPGQLAYGAAGRGKIGPNQALIFELTLLEIIGK